MSRLEELPPDERLVLVRGLLQDISNTGKTGVVDLESIKAYCGMISEPVPVRQFLEDPYYLGMKGEIYPNVMTEMMELNNGMYDEAVLTGSIGSAKSTIAILTNAYQLYRLSLYENPQSSFGLDSSSEIMFVFQSITGNLSKIVGYDRFRELIRTSPYFKENFPHRFGDEKMMRFPKRIIVRYLTGSASAAIGQNVFGGLIDEVNSMAVVKREAKDGGRASEFDQAQELYTSLARRRESRFMRRGKLPGILCLVSSNVYPGQFTDRKREEARAEREARGKSSIYLYNKRIWEVVPKDRFTGKFFKVFTGDLSDPPRIVERGEKLTKQEKKKILRVPVEFKKNFEMDIIGALRDIGGISLYATSPFFVRRDLVAKCFGKSKSIFKQDSVDLKTEMLDLQLENLVNPGEPRFVHIDLGLSVDSCGFCIGHVSKFVSPDDDDSLEMLPMIHIDGVLEIKPPKNDEINIASIREGIIYRLRNTHGVPIKYVSMDSFQSKDTLQILKARGFITGTVSVDRDDVPYTMTKAALYSGRIALPQHDLLKKELGSLEIDVDTKKIDHPPQGCFTGETRVALADGTCPMFRDLVGRDEFDVYSIDGDGVSIRPARNARVTKTTSDLVEVMLDNHQVIRCTSDHLFMTLYGDWVRAGDLTPEVPLMPLYRSVAGKGGTKGYERVWCPIRERRVLTHHLGVDCVPKGFVVHHKDHNKTNNSRDNLQVMSRRQHVAMHSRELWDSRKEAMAKGREKHYEVFGTGAQSRLMKRLWAEGKFGGSRKECAVHGCPSLSNARGLCGKHYQKARREKALPPRTSNQKNHRILSVTKVDGFEEVYDLAVPGTENFALASGVFVHNSKDVADALAGVVKGLTSLREIWIKHGVRFQNPNHYLRNTPSMTVRELDGGPDKRDFDRALSGR